ncbi:MAG: Clp protease ClpP [Bacteroidota bacterium]|nr:Clp protease ClpP [Bacteroidota bacterium]
MLINKHIGFDTEDGQGIDGSIFQSELLALNEMGKKRIQIWINSVGGSVMDGYNICNAILKSQTRVDTYCLGMAASIAAVIFQTGRKRIMADYSILMYHNPYSEGADGKKTTESPLLQSMKDSLNKIISQRAGMAAVDVTKMLDRTSFIQADEAERLGLCDEIEDTETMNTKNLPKNDFKLFYAEANKVLNKLIFKNNKMIKVTNKLSLTEDANEDSIIKAIDEVVNKAVEDATAVLSKKSNDDLDKMKTEMEDLEAKLKDAKDAFENAQSELDTEKEKAEKVEEAAKEEKAKNLITENVKAGKIKNEATAVSEWIEKAKADMKGVQAMLDSIPVNKSAEKFELNVEKKEIPNSVALEMARISNKLDKK